MSLAAALKAGLTGAKKPEPEAAGGWDPYPEGAGAKARPRQEARPAAAQPARTPAQPQPQPQRAARAEQDLPAGRTGADALRAQRRDAPPPRPANVNARAAQTAADRKVAALPAKRQGNAWMSDAGNGAKVNPQQYVRELERYLAAENRRATREAVMQVSSQEIEGVASMAARIRGRYLARLIDAGGPGKAALLEGEVKELSRYREMHEELVHGLELLKTAIAEGDIACTGMISR